MKHFFIAITWQILIRNYLIVYLVKSKGYILYTDYVDYSLEVKCDAEGNVDALFMSRFHDALPDTVISNFNKILEGYNVDVSDYVPIYHDHTVCGH